VKHLENDLNPIHSQPLFTCHKESLTMIFPHPESQFSDRQKNAHTHLVKKYWDFRKWLSTSPWFITLFSLLPPSTLRKEYLAMLSDLPTKLLIPHTGCCYKWAYTQDIDTSQPYWSRLPGGREVAGAINSSSHFLHHPTPFHTLQSLGPNEYRSHTKSLHKSPLPQVSFVISRGFWAEGTDFTWDE